MGEYMFFMPSYTQPGCQRSFSARARITSLLMAIEKLDLHLFQQLIIPAAVLSYMMLKLNAITSHSDGLQG